MLHLHVTDVRIILLLLSSVRPRYNLEASLANSPSSYKMRLSLIRSHDETKSGVSFFPVGRHIMYRCGYPWYARYLSLGSPSPVV